MKEQIKNFIENMSEAQERVLVILLGGVGFLLALAACGVRRVWDEIMELWRVIMGIT